MLPTPLTSHADIKRVYEPAEDSFLFLDTLSSAIESQFLKKRFGGNHTGRERNISQPSPLIFEIGTGSGIILAFIAAQAEALFGRNDILTLGTDVNRFACEATGQTVLQACRGTRESPRIGGFLATLTADLICPLRAEAVDVLIFNPPYVPSLEVPALPGSDSKAFPVTGGSRKDSLMHDSYLLSLSYEGGTNGMEVTDRLLEQLPHVLNKERGVAYILLCQQNRPEEVMKRICRWGPTWSVAVAGKSGKKAGWEKLQIIRISRQ